jgi:hypothetical protein
MIAPPVAPAGPGRDHQDRACRLPAGSPLPARGRWHCRLNSGRVTCWRQGAGSRPSAGEAVRPDLAAGGGGQVGGSGQTGGCGQAPPRSAPSMLHSARARTATPPRARAKLAHLAPWAFADSRPECHPSSEVAAFRPVRCFRPAILSLVLGYPARAEPRAGTTLPASSPIARASSPRVGVRLRVDFPPPYTVDWLSRRANQATDGESPAAHYTRWGFLRRPIV